MSTNLTRIDYGVFYECSGLVSVKLPDTLTALGEKAFFGCKALKLAVVPVNLKKIGFCAFGMCTNLASVVFSRKAPPACITWAVGVSRNRTNWQITTLKHSHNILRLITTFAVPCPRVNVDVDKIAAKHLKVFWKCKLLEKGVKNAHVMS